MPKSEFDRDVKVSDRQFLATGSYVQGSGVDFDPRPNVCVMIEQGDWVGRGAAEIQGTFWSVSGPAPEEWTPGPARATGVAISLTPHTRDCYVWQEEVMLVFE
jgi:hypothetical protein